MKLAGEQLRDAQSTSGQTSAETKDMALALRADMHADLSRITCESRKQSVHLKCWSSVPESSRTLPERWMMRLGRSLWTLKASWTVCQWLWQRRSRVRWLKLWPNRPPPGRKLGRGLGKLHTRKRSMWKNKPWLQALVCKPEPAIRETLVTLIYRP